MTDKGQRRIQSKRVTIPERVGDTVEVNYGTVPAPDYGPLARDRIPVRAMKETDLRAIVEIDRRINGYGRAAYFERKLEEALHGSDVRVSLVAELDNEPVGFIMARVDYGEFGRLEPAAVLDTIGVDLTYRDKGVGRALLSQLLINLMTLRVECIRTELEWRDHELLAFLDRCGFHASQRLCLEHVIE
jgi:ribosomal protein S18 acetylase RimI-like enzyme